MPVIKPGGASPSNGAATGISGAISMSPYLPCSNSSCPFRKFDEQPPGDSHLSSAQPNQDLVRGAPPSIRVHDRLQKSLPPRCVAIAEQWRTTCNDVEFTDTIHALRYTTQQTARADLVNELREIAPKQRQAGRLVNEGPSLPTRARPAGLG